MESKDLLALCKQHNIDAKNQLSTIEPEVRDQIVDLVKRGPATPTPQAPRAVAPAPVQPPTERKIVNLDQARSAQPPARPTPPAPPRPPQSAPPAPVAVTTQKAPPAPVAPTPTVAAPVVPAAVSPREVPAPEPPPAPVVRPEAASPPATAPPAAVPPPAAPAPQPQAAPTAVAPAPAAATPAATPARPAPVAAAAIPSQEKPVIPADKTLPPAANVNPPAQPQPAAPAPQAPRPPVAEAARPPAAPQPTAPPPRPQTSTAGSGPVPNMNQGRVRTMTPPRPGGGAPTPGQANRPGGGRSLHSAAGRQPISGRTTGGTPPQPPQQARPPVKPPEPPKKPETPTGARKISNIPPELLASMQAGGRPLTPKDIEDSIRRQKEAEKQPPAQPPRAGGPGTAAPAPVPDDDEEGAARKRNAGGGGGPGGVAGRADRHKERNERQAKRKAEEPKGGKLTALLDDEGPRWRKARHPKIKAPITEKRKGKIPLAMPITVRSLSEAMGRKSGEVLMKLVAHGAPMTTTLNSFLDPEQAELVAIDYGLELDIKREASAEETLIDSHAKKDEEADLLPRAPVVTIMGHVDHGKTSLLDRIRNSNVVDTEAGGITQVIRAWRVEHNGKPITFLDTPGHEAFTKMRARGAHVTDIVVIVVAANDGVMPQTEEAINHAKASGVSIVVAINKVDLPDANLKKTEQQLYSLGLVPDNMGGDVPFVYTSARTGKGIDDLLENLAVVAELEDLKANPNKPASGTCLEAHLSEKEGVFATVLVQDGTLRPGDVVLCGSTYGTIRKMYDDRGRAIAEAGPSMPVRLTGLDEVPDADDPFLVVKDLTTARGIAALRKERTQAKALHVRPPVSLDTLKDAEIAELKVILKAEARGSIEAIRAELEKLHHDEVRVRVLHAAIGGITVSDVQLALTSPEDTLILGFNAVPDDAARQLADERGIQIREYNIIYRLAEDIRSALEGKLKPREDVIHLGRAIVRETFKISRVGTIAGCFVTSGVIERSGKVRVVRAGVVVYPPADKTVGLDSLKRFKEDAREVREGFECGLKISGYDDIKVGDAIECYRIEQVQRTLSQ